MAWQTFLAALALGASLLTLGGPTAQAVGPETSTLESDPDWRDARAALDRGDPAAALTHLKILLASHEGDPGVQTLLGFAYRKLKDYPTSWTHYARALAIDPTYRPALEYQGEWFLETGDRAAAQANLARLGAVCGRCPEYLDLEKAIAAAR